MTETEKLIWAAAFANFYQKEYNFIEKYRQQAPHLDYEKISGYTCGEWADEVLKKYREAIECEDSEYLTPIKENWDER